MALTLAEANKLSNTRVMPGVIETIIYESGVLNRLPFIEINGNSLTYNRESTLPTTSFYAVGDQWAEGTPTFTQATASLKILGGDADVDNFLRQTRSDIQDLESTILESKLKSLAHTFDNTFLNGDDSVDLNAFDGLHNLVSTSSPDQSITGHADGIVLSLAHLDQLIDTIKPGRPDLLLMSKRSRRKILTLARGSGVSLVESSRDEFGRPVDMYGGIPIAVTDWQSDTESQGGSGAVCSTIFAMRFGEDGLCGLNNGWVVTENLGKLESKDATRWRVKFYCGLALFSAYALAELTGVKDS